MCLRLYLCVCVCVSAEAAECATVRALLRHGANLEAVISQSKVENTPIRCAVGSNSLHIAALTGNIVMAKLILEAQVRGPPVALAQVFGWPNQASQHPSTAVHFCHYHRQSPSQ